MNIPKKGERPTTSKEVHLWRLSNITKWFVFPLSNRFLSFYTSINRQADGPAKQSTEMVDNPVEKADAGPEPLTITRLFRYLAKN